MAHNILLKPIITEKAEALSEGSNKYSFIVYKKANKLEIRKAIEEKYGVKVKRVNTLIMPSKAKSRNTKSRVLIGRVPSYKKAIISLKDGETINFFGDA